MGHLKNEQMMREDKIQKAIDLCIEVGAMAKCPNHDGEYIDSEEYSDCLELTSKILEENPNALLFFSSRDEMEECVCDAMASAGEDCGYCAKNRRE